MGLLDGMLGQLGGDLDVNSLAAKVGLSPGQAESAVAALAQAHPQSGDTVQTADDSTGLPTDVLQQVVGHLGGQGGLGQLVNLFGASGATSS